MLDISKYVGQTVKVLVDRPIGSKHPKFDFVYPINYGYVPNTIAADGEEIDVYVLGVKEPLKEFAGQCIAIIHRLNDDDDKLIVVPQGTRLSNEEIMKATEFQERYFKSEILR